MNESVNINDEPPTEQLLKLESCWGNLGKNSSFNGSFSTVLQTETFGVS